MKITPSNITRALCIGFILGVLVLSWGLSLDREVQWIWLLTFILIILGVAWRVREVGVALVLIAICGCAFGSVKYMQSFPTELSVANFAGLEIVVEGEVKDVEIRNGWQRIVLSDLVIDGQLVKDNAQIITLPYPEFVYGDFVRARCELKAPGMIEDFAYDRYLASKDIYATCFTYNVLFESGGKGGLKSALLGARQVFIDRLDRVFGEPHGSLLVGLLLGEQRFSEIWQERFLQTGTTHIVAASGYNISVVLWIAMGFFASIGVKRQRAFAFLVAAIAGYILLAGADAAVFRAGVMGIVLVIARQTGRRTSMVNILLLTASIMLLINPRLLRDDVGFQLSMMSTIGLIYLSPSIEKAVRWLPKQLVIQESVVATCAATFMSLPIILLQFGEFSLISLFANVFVLPWIPLAMAGGSIATLVGFISVKVAAIISGPAWLALSVMLWIVEVFASLDLFMRAIHWLVVGLVLLVWLIINYKIWFSKIST
ncbi:hypothetical protein HN358_04690 [Candidatus Uhrbacteria bacterium]|jgi:competence protein ComEC|nr:hypothetical protein [Candidatus Uhrbacteria bacterium]MBT7717080.1 hypothetical protein [Candidatus Uhrbacteria bacterium]